MSLIDDILGEHGLFAQRLEEYEFRPEQLEMAKAVFKAIMDKKHIVVEAGTGVGKSFGYLVPALLSLNPEDKPIVVSTNTINLQEQLTQKDLPWLKENLGIPFTFELGKGRNNYISLRRLGIALEKKNTLFETNSQTDELRMIGQWAQQTEDGSKSSINFNPSHQVWDQVQSDKDNCLGRKCPTYSKCFYYKSRQALKNADLIVVNHALLFVDLQLRSLGKSVLPTYKRLIIDEAHKMENVASDHLGFSVSQYQFMYLFNQILNTKKDKGFFANHRLKYTIEPAIVSAVEKIEEFFINVFGYLNDHTSYTETILRIRESRIVDTSPLAEMRNLYDRLDEALASTENEDEMVQIKSFMEKIISLLQVVTFIIFREGEEKYVYWIEKRGVNENNIHLFAAPILVAPQLETMLFKVLDSVTMTSATISVDKEENGFQFFANRVGVKEPETLLTGSPFDYKNNATIYIPENMPPANDENFNNQSILAIKHYVNLTQGGCLILFTSYSAMEHAFLSLQHQFELSGFRVLCQGKNKTRSQLISEFKQSMNSVLFGTDSFWEGVDIPGDILRNVIITKLPFSVPSHPVTQAKYEYIESIGKRSFTELALPEAIIKFKQGFGRLIRTKRDQGIVVILDTRILSKPYGKKFLAAIPQCEIEYDHLEFIKQL